MRVVRRFPLRLLLASSIFLLLPLWAVASKSKDQSKDFSKFAGVYESSQANPEKPGPSMSLSLGIDGSATFTQDYGKGPQTFFGHWVDTGGGVKVTFDDPGQPAEAPMNFAPSHGGMQAVNWDRAAWGKLTPPEMKKTSDHWHAKGHHKIF